MLYKMLFVLGMLGLFYIELYITLLPFLPQREDNKMRFCSFESNPSPLSRSSSVGSEYCYQYTVSRFSTCKFV